MNEIEHGLPKETIEALISEKRVTDAALAAADKILQNPPKETIWFTHGMLIAAMAERLGIDKQKLFIPEMASVSKITLP